MAVVTTVAESFVVVLRRTRRVNAGYHRARYNLGKIRVGIAFPRTPVVVAAVIITIRIVFPHLFYLHRINELQRFLPLSSVAGKHFVLNWKN